MRRIRQGLRTVLTGRLAGRFGQADGERGAAIIEFALVLPILVTLTFGIVEFSSAYHDSSVTADAARAGGRVGSALATSPSFATSTVAAVNAALETLPADDPQELWIYKANADGFPGTTRNFSSCTSNCIKYKWDSSRQAFDTSRAARRRLVRIVAPGLPRAVRRDRRVREGRPPIRDQVLRHQRDDRGPLGLPVRAGPDLRLRPVTQRGREPRAERRAKRARSSSGPRSS